MFRQKTCTETSTCLTGSHTAAQPPLSGDKSLCQAVTQAATGAWLTLSYASRMVRRKKAAASLSLISRWKRCLRLGMGRPRPKQGSPLSCIRDTEATMPSATPRACRQQVKKGLVCCGCLVLHLQQWGLAKAVCLRCAGQVAGTPAGQRAAALL